MNSLFVTIPHAGEEIPALTPWLKGLPEEVVMCDVDRYVDRLYASVLQKQNIPHLVTQWHRYAGDLNRLAEDVDAGTVQGHPNTKGQFSRGFHWALTTTNLPLMKEAMPLSTHEALVKLIYDPFHEKIKQQYEKEKQLGRVVYHMDLHSMPSLGTTQHRDPGELRAEVVVSDQMGKSCRREFRDLVLTSYLEAGFKVALNWPYYGGRITEQYGAPEKQIHVIQVELNRALYMDEVTKKWLPEKAEKTIPKLTKAIENIAEKLKLIGMK